MDPVLSQLLAGGQIAGDVSKTPLSGNFSATGLEEFTTTIPEDQQLAKAGFAHLLGLLVDGAQAGSMVDVETCQQATGDGVSNIELIDSEQEATDTIAESDVDGEQATFVVPVTISLVSTSNSIDENALAVTNLDEHIDPVLSKSTQPFFGSLLVVNDTSSLAEKPDEDANVVSTENDQELLPGDDSSQNGETLITRNAADFSAGLQRLRPMNSRTNDVDPDQEFLGAEEVADSAESLRIDSESAGVEPDASANSPVEPIRAVLLATARSSHRMDTAARDKARDAGPSAGLEQDTNTYAAGEDQAIETSSIGSGAQGGPGDTPYRREQVGRVSNSTTSMEQSNTGSEVPSNEVGPSSIPFDLSMLTAETGARTTQPVDVASQVFESFRVATDADGDVPARVEVELDPPELGKISVELTDSSRGVVARITASSEATAALVESQLSHLRHSLEQAGVQVHEFHVTPDFNASQSQDFHRQTPRGRFDVRRGARVGRESLSVTEVPVPSVRRVPVGRIDLRI